MNELSAIQGRLSELFAAYQQGMPVEQYQQAVQEVVQQAPDAFNQLVQSRQARQYTPLQIQGAATTFMPRIPASNQPKPSNSSWDALQLKTM